MDRPSAGLRWRSAEETADLRDATTAPLPQGLRPPRKRKGLAISKVKKPSKVSTSAASTASSAPENKQECEKRIHDCVLAEDFQDLALPLGMSFAAVLSQVLSGKIVFRDQLPAENISMICSSAVKESVSNIYGDRFDSFLRNFEKSFDSTLKTLLVFDKASTQKIGRSRERLIYQSYNDDEQRNSSCSSLGAISSEEPLQEHEELSSTNQLVLRSELHQQLARSSDNSATSNFSKSVLTAFEKSVTEQTRSNNLKEVEIGLTMRKLQMKQSQLVMSSYANWLEKVKICMNMSKAAFNEEKLRNRIQDSRHAELTRKCIDMLVSGLILMCAFLIYGAVVFSYQRITEATSFCAAMSKESKFWWMPKPVASFSSGWQMLRCHATVITRMLFGLLMILVIAYSLIQRSAASGPAVMPITSIFLLLGVACGVAGKLCVDSLGGSGCRWLFYWEVLCLVHLFSSVFPSVVYRALYGQILPAKEEKAARLPPYWMRRYAFYGTVLLVLPTMAGLLPFASMADWKDHFAERIKALFIT